MAAWSDALLGRFGSAPRSSSSLTISRCPRAAAFLEGRRSHIISDVLRDAVGERGILVEQFPHRSRSPMLAAVQMSRKPRGYEDAREPPREWP